MQALLKVAQQSGLLQRAGAAGLPLVSSPRGVMGAGAGSQRPHTCRHRLGATQPAAGGPAYERDAPPGCP